MQSINRRAAIIGAAAVAGQRHLASATWAATSSSSTKVRVSIASLSAGDPLLNALRAGINKMKALSSSDRRNWNNQVNIHYNFCPHGNWYLLPWHRAYLLQFENIVATLSNQSAFAMPYWDWTVDRKIPASFAAPTYNGQPNPLYDPNRNLDPTVGLPDDMVGPSVIDSILSESSFEVFGSSRGSVTMTNADGSTTTTVTQNSTASSWQRAQGSQGPLEYNPHNRVHDTLGGDMTTFHSPNDPLFWLHHSNVDRLWSVWNARGDADTADSLWTNFQFAGQFVNASKPSQYWSPFVRDLVKPSALGYAYTNGYGA